MTDTIPGRATCAMILVTLWPITGRPLAAATRRGVLLLGALLVTVVLASSAVADEGFSPLGPQRVLVVPLLIQAPFCPDATQPCPDQSLLNQFGPPRHTAAEWEQILNTQAKTYWRLTTYGQTDPTFVVFANPARAEGWWPAAHSYQQYASNPNFTASPPHVAVVPDGIRSMVDAVCAGVPAVLCRVNFAAFTRAIVLLNFHGFGGQSNDNNVAAGVQTSVGTLTLTQSVVDEGPDDSIAVPLLLHEFGHQLGLTTHYGDCASVYDPPQAQPIECVSPWDIMGRSGPGDFPQLTGFSRVHGGWVEPASTVTIPLGPTSVSQTVTIAPLEVPPSGGPNLIRLPTSSLSNPQFSGFFVECRQRINGDQGLPGLAGSSGIPAEGVLVTSVHEASLPTVNPMHVVRIGGAVDSPFSAALAPGESLTVPGRGLTVRFNHYVDVGSFDMVPRLLPPSCEIQIDYTPPHFYLLLSQYPSLLSALEGPGATSQDIAFDRRFPVDQSVGRPKPVDPPWGGHDNLIALRLHNEGTVQADGVVAAVAIASATGFSDDCGPPPQTVAHAAFAPIAPDTSGTATVHWTPQQETPIWLQVTPTIGEQIVPSAGTGNTTGFAFQFHHGDSPVVTSIPFETVATCPEPRTFVLHAVGVPADWQVDISPPSLTLAPGTRGTIDVRVQPPAATPGLAVEIPLALGQVTVPAAPVGAERSSILGMDRHFHLVPALTLFARVVGPSARTKLSCPATMQAGRPRAVTGTITPVPPPGSPILIEYRAPSGLATSHLVETDDRGAFQDDFAPLEQGHWTVQARWGGDDAHEPAESQPCPSIVMADR